MTLRYREERQFLLTAKVGGSMPLIPVIAFYLFFLNGCCFLFVCLFICFREKKKRNAWLSYLFGFLPFMPN